MPKSKGRLNQTKKFFEMNISASRIIHERIEICTTKNVEKIKEMITEVKLTDDSKQLLDISKKLSRLLKSNYLIAMTDDKSTLIHTLKDYKEKELSTKYISTMNTITSLYSYLEAFMRNMMLKYYEDDVRRLTESNKTIQYSELVTLVLGDELILRKIAEEIVEKDIRGSIEVWVKKLHKMGFDKFILSDTTRELTLVRHAIVHNSSRGSKELADKFPKFYEQWKRINISNEKLEDFFSSTHKTVTWLQKEYGRLYKVPYTSYDQINYGIDSSSIESVDMSDKLTMDMNIPVEKTPLKKGVSE